MKCPVCSSRKGKRPCRIHDAPICSLCCGTIRTQACEGCSFYSPPTRNYRKLPRFTTIEMEERMDLQLVAYPIEKAICTLDESLGMTLTDDDAIAILELVLDRLACGDAREDLAPRIERLRCAPVFDFLERELADQDPDTVAKVAASCHFTAVKRNRGGRHHMQLLHDFTRFAPSPSSPGTTSDIGSGHFVPLSERCPELAERETRTIIATGASDDLPAGVYILDETYCADPRCDCRRVIFRIIHQKSEDSDPRHVTTVGYGWEPLSFYRQWLRHDPSLAPGMKGPGIEFGAPHWPHASDMLSTLESTCLADPAYVQRLARHYQEFKKRSA